MSALRGLYLVVDPAVGMEVLAPKIESAVQGGVDVLQVWDHWMLDQDKETFVSQLLNVVSTTVPVLINNDQELARMDGIAGIHLDDYNEVQKLPFEPGIVGVTLTDRLEWSELNGQKVDYISFCSMFPSTSTDACRLVDFRTVREACKYFNGSVFASGGITITNLHEILDLGVSGIAMISGILKAEDPYATAKSIKERINNYEKNVFQETLLSGGQSRSDLEGNQRDL